MKLATITYDSCKVSPRCDGCYIETLKAVPKKASYKYPQEIINENDEILFNISHPSDIDKLPSSVPNNKSFAVIIPPAILKLRYTQLKEFWRDFKIFLSINVSVKTEHIDSVKSLKLDKVEMSLTTQELYDLANNIKYRNVDQIAHKFEIVKRLDAPEILLNVIKLDEYFPNEQKVTPKNIYLLMNKIVVNNPDNEITISPCVQHGVGLNECPAVVSNSKDYVDGILRADGCPFPYKTCEE